MVPAAALTTIAILASAGAAFGQPPAVGPTWSSDQVRAARSVAPEQALAFDLRQETAQPGAPMKVETYHVVLAPDFNYVTSGATHTLDDFQLHRTFIWSDGGRGFANLNGHALPAFRVLELANRKVLEAILAHTGATTGKPLAPPNLDPYWREAELGVNETADTPLTPRRNASGTDFLLGSDPVVRTDGHALNLTEADRRPLTRWFALHLPLHPQVRHALTQESALPARMELEAYTLNKKRTTSVTFSAAMHKPADYPLPARLEADVVPAAVEPGDTVSAAGVRAAIQAIEGHSIRPKPSADEIIAALRAAAAKGRAMEVWLWFNAYVQQYAFKLHGADGPELTRTLGPLIRSAVQDPEVARFNSASTLASNLPGVAGDREGAARYLASAKSLDALPFGTFRYLTFANLVAGSKDVGKWDRSIFAAMPSPLVANDWTHIAAYPWAANAYKDAGDLEIRRFDTPRAWAAFDLGRAVDPDWRSGGMRDVARYEAILEANEPDFF